MSSPPKGRCAAKLPRGDATKCGLQFQKRQEAQEVSPQRMRSRATPKRVDGGDEGIAGGGWEGGGWNALQVGGLDPHDGRTGPSADGSTAPHVEDPVDALGAGGGALTFGGGLLRGGLRERRWL